MEAVKLLYQKFLLCRCLLSHDGIWWLPIIEVLEWYVYYLPYCDATAIAYEYEYLVCQPVFTHRYHFFSASIWLTCHQQECTLELTPPGSRTITVVFARTQLQSAQAIKTDSAGNFLEIDTEKYEPPRKQKGKKYTSKYNKKGPDEQGRYRTYRIKFHEAKPDTGEERQEEDAPDGDFEPAKKFMNKEEDGTWSLHMRHFGLVQSRTRVRANVNKVESYIKKRRQKLMLKENATLPWQGILFLVFGLMGFLLTLLIGQFYDETPKRQGGPGTRRSGGVGTAGKKQPSFVYNSGRPSKYPPGYQYQKKY